ncbi:hypothetical protein BaRGS_00014576 [Batillaria attramentaria]|uniref:Uncharacterized protein n=1 Tax=Batillaria attramentaria TaxID=370345 RepID=A0ABD0L4G0_9CAEN
MHTGKNFTTAIKRANILSRSRQSTNLHLHDFVTSLDRKRGATRLPSTVIALSASRPEELQGEINDPVIAASDAWRDQRTFVTVLPV